MPLHALTRHHELHEIDQQWLDSHPSEVGRILLAVLPLVFVLISHLPFLARNSRINHNFQTRTFPPTFFFVVATLASLAAAITVGVWIALSDVWTVKVWILFAASCALAGWAAQTYTADSHPTVALAAVVVALAAVANEWLFIQTKNMVELDTNLTDWKHITRNFIGFNEAVLIIWFFQLVGQNLVHNLRTTNRTETIFFWVAAPLTVAGILVWNILSNAPFFDSIGYLVGAIFLFIGAAASTLFFKEEEPLSASAKR